MKTEFNLIPSEYLSGRTRCFRVRRLLIFLGLAAVICSAQFFACAWMRLDDLGKGRLLALKERDEALKEIAELEKEQRILHAEALRWEKVISVSRSSLPVMELLARVSQAIPETGRLEYLFADAERCRVDILLPDVTAADGLTKKLGILRGFGPFSAGGQRLGRQGLPLFRYDALRGMQP